MATTTGVWASAASAQNLSRINATDNSAKAADSGSDSDSATISANDFLTLLVTEMKNQDPTATTDPNEYINQLVSVNSLQQLISINQTLTGDLSTTADSQTARPSASFKSTPSAPVHGTPAQPVEHTTIADAALPHTAGNLGVPAASAAAQRVAHSLDGIKSRL